MTHRLDLQVGIQRTTILFQGLLDWAAFYELKALCRAEQGKTPSVCVRLGAGTKVEGPVLEALARTDGILLEAESPFLTQWIRSCLE